MSATLQRPRPRPHTGADDVAPALTVAIVATNRATLLGLGALLRSERGLVLTGTTMRDRAQMLKTVAREHPDVVLLDLSLDRQPELLECCRQLREAAPNTELVVFTSATGVSIVERTQEVGVLGVVSHQGDPKELVRAVLHAGAHQPYVCTFFRQHAEASDLSARQESILGLIAEGLDTQDVAARLNVSPETVKSHVKAILAKLGAHGRAHAVAIGIRRGLID